MARAALAPLLWWTTWGNWCGAGIGGAAAFRAVTSEDSLGEEQGMATQVAFSTSALTNRLSSATTSRPSSVDAKKGNIARYRVLSYNICWGCMEADKSDTTGMQSDLAVECMKKVGKTTQCARTMGEAIFRYHSEARGYHLMAFQEASKFEDLGLTKTWPDMSWIRHGVPVPKTMGKGQVVKQNYVVSMYNVSRVGKHDAFVKGALKSDAGRPWLILIFDKAELLFINMHNCQEGRGEQRVSWSQFPKEMEAALKQPFSKKPKRKEYRIILAGDFNDMEGKLLNTILITWSKTTLHLSKPVTTCCSRTVNVAPKYFGDYIFDSAAPTTNRLPPSYDNSKAQSDHKPVEAELGPQRPSVRTAALGAKTTAVKGQTGKTPAAAAKKTATMHKGKIAGSPPKKARGDTTASHQLEEYAVGRGGRVRDAGTRRAGHNKGSGKRGVDVGRPLPAGASGDIQERRLTGEGSEQGGADPYTGQALGGGFAAVSGYPPMYELPLYPHPVAPAYEPMQPNYNGGMVMAEQGRLGMANPQFVAPGPPGSPGVEKRKFKLLGSFRRG